MSEKIVFERTNRPLFIMMVGLAGSGKSTIAQNIVIKNASGVELPPIVHSSDALQLKLYGDDKDQEHNGEVFAVLKTRIKDDLKNKKSVVFDATNLNKKQRVAFLAELKKIQCHKMCVCVMTPYETCLKLNSDRERQVPEHAIRRMYMNWTPPHQHEGFDEVVLRFNVIGQDESFDLVKLWDRLNDIDQENSHHAYTIGKHCLEAAEYTKSKNPYDRVLNAATCLHDIGKEFTKTRINGKGVEDGECHYYQHQCVGAYDSMFYLKEIGFSNKEILDVSNMIYYHMHPYVSWRHSEKALNRDKRMIGEEMYNKVMQLHEADRLAHGPSKKRALEQIHEEEIEIER